MSKKNKNKVSSVTAPVVSITSGAPVAPASGISAEEEQKITKLQEEIKALQAARIEREKAAAAKLAADLDALPATFGVADLDTFVQLVRKHMRVKNGGSKATGGTGRGRRIEQSVKDAIDADIKADKDTVAVIAERHGVSAPYVQNRRSALGMVKARATAAGK